MTLEIPNDVLERSGLTQQELLIELAWLLFDKGEACLRARRPFGRSLSG